MTTSAIATAARLTAAAIRAGAQAPDRLRPHPRPRREHPRGDRGQRGEGGVGRAALAGDVAQHRLQLVLGARHLGQAEALEGGVVGPQVAGREAVGDDRAAADVGLEHGQAGGRVDHRVGRRHPVAHLLGEAEDPHLLVAAEALLQLLAGDLVAAGDADDEGVLVGERRVDRALEVADPPAAAGDEHEPGVGGDAERLRGRRGGCAASGTRGEIGGRIHSTLPGPTSLSTSSIDSGWVT